jgi:hypothetical protein
VWGGTCAWNGVPDDGGVENGIRDKKDPWGSLAHFRQINEAEQGADGDDEGKVQSKQEASIDARLDDGVNDVSEDVARRCRLWRSLCGEARRSRRFGALLGNGLGSRIRGLELHRLGHGKMSDQGSEVRLYCWVACAALTLAYQ